MIQGLEPEKYKVTTTKKLMDDKQLANLKIICCTLDYKDEEKKDMKKKTYQEEIDWLVTNPDRNEIIKNLTIAQDGNTLLLFQFVEKHGRVLYNMLKDEDRSVFFVHGGTDTETREEIRALTEKESNAIIVASYGTFSTGINIRNLHNIVFASPSKSRIRNLQSIGRGLRRGDKKVVCNLFDIGDDLSWKSHKNYTLNHLIERIKLYNEEGFNYKLVKINV